MLHTSLCCGVCWASVKMKSWMVDGLNSATTDKTPRLTDCTASSVDCCTDHTTAPASECEAVVRSPTNMAAANIATVDFIDLYSTKWGQNDVTLPAACLRPCLLACASQSKASNASPGLTGRKKSSEYLICLWYRQTNTDNVRHQRRFVPPL